MANNLKREIEEGEFVIVDKKYLKPEFRELERRIVTCHGGFGMSNVTMGTAISAHWPDGEKSRIEGYWIDAKATEKMQADPWYGFQFTNEYGVNTVVYKLGHRPGIGNSPGDVWYLVREPNVSTFLHVPLSVLENFKSRQHGT